MTEKLKQTIEEEIAELPKEGREAIGAVPWIKIAEEIGNTHHLTEEEIEDFQLETLLVLIGAVDYQFYAINIENHVGATKEEATNIAKEALEKIFAPISSLLEENIKKNLGTKNPNWQQNLNFTLSGGNYSAFIIPPLPARPAGGLNKEGNEERGNVHPPTLQDIKNKLMINYK